ncbi:MAG: indolepyruvate ferredoxin oxidoreductase family protein, partial [Acidimicrobiales bacterium]
MASYERQGFADVTLYHTSPSDGFTENDGRVALTGLEALARLPIAQLRADRSLGYNTAAFLSGYRRSPIAGFDDQLDYAIEQVPDLPIKSRPAATQELGATAVMGSQLVSSQPDAQYEGIAGFWYGTVSCLDRAAAALRHANYVGASCYGGAVAVVGDDPAGLDSPVPT